MYSSYRRERLVDRAQRAHHRLRRVLDSHLAVNGTLSRTFMTSVTTLLALIALAILGGPIIRDFSFAMIWGVVIGTFSSIFVAVPVLLLLNFNRESITSSSGGDAVTDEKSD